MRKNPDYFLIAFDDLKSKKIFSFNLYIMNPQGETYSKFLPANSPLDNEKMKFLEFIFERGARLAISQKQKRTFLHSQEMNEEDIEDLADKGPHPLEQAQKMYAKLLEAREKKEGPLKFKEAFQSASYTGNFLPIILRAHDEIMAFPPNVSHTTSLATYLADNLLTSDNETNRIVAISYFMAKNFDIKSYKELGDLVCASFIHHIGLAHITPTAIKGPYLNHHPDDKKLMTQHMGLTQHLIRKSGLELSKRAIDIILDHHERANGSGFPNQKKEEHIDILSLILGAVSHIFEFSSGRINGQKQSVDMIIKRIKNKTFTPGLELEFGDKMNENLESLLGSTAEDKKAA